MCVNKRARRAGTACKAEAYYFFSVNSIKQMHAKGFFCFALLQHMGT